MKRVLITCDNTSIADVAAIQNQPFDSTFPIKRIPPNENLNLKITNITHCILKNLDPILEDLLVIATFVYAADSDVLRGTDTTIFEGEEWQRDFTFIIPCQNSDLWNSADVNNRLKQMLEFLTGDRFTFYFVKGKSSPNQMLIEFSGENLPLFQGATCVSLFSGGLDSLSGIVADVKQGLKPLLISHRSSPSMDHLQKGLVDALKNRLTQWSFPHLSLWANRHGERKTEYTQRSRSLLYFSLATVVAAQCNLDTVRFYENGIITFNLPLLAQNVGTRLTRTTHPRFIIEFSQLVKLILPTKTIKYENPFLWKTKEEIVDGLKNDGLAELIEGTVSCTRMWMMTKKERHCGVCSQCVDRRFATESQGAQENDPIDGYQIDLFTQDLKDGADKSCAIGYIQTAVKISEIQNAGQFFVKYPELYAAFTYLDGNSSDKANNIYGLFKRHTSNVIAVMAKMIEKHSDDLVKGKLPESCLISMVGAQQQINKLPHFQSSTLKADRNSKKELIKDIHAPSNIQWHDITIEMESNYEYCKISWANNKPKRCKYDRLGFENKRATKEKKPNRLWDLLIRFAVGHGELSWQKGGLVKRPSANSETPDGLDTGSFSDDDEDQTKSIRICHPKDQKIINKMKTAIKELRDRLQTIFPNISGNPIPEKDGIYKTQFNIELEVK